MTHWTEATDLLDEREPAPSGLAARAAPAAFAFLMSAALGAYLVYLRPVAFAPAPRPAEPAALNTQAFGGLAPVAPAPRVLAAKPEASPFGQIELKGFEPDTQLALEENPAPTPPVAPRDLRAPSAADEAPTPPVAPPDLRTPLADSDVPVPPRRPSELLRPAEPAPRQSEPAVARAEPRPAPSEPSVARLEPRPAPTPGLFDKLLPSGPAISGRTPQDNRVAVAVAAPPPVAAGGMSNMPMGRGGSPSFGGFLRGLTFGESAPSRYGDRVAIYDISNHVVILPDGTRLEAHSGLGESRDDPNKVSQPMRGPTPPATYALSPRQGSFHGVDALRLTPLDRAIYGRAGLLAHTYMLGPNGDSNGCVSFRDYQAFLRAYRNGQINKLVVVSRL